MLNNSLTANGKQLYMDYHDGKYGINTDSKRGADTFHPFSSGVLNELYYGCGGTGARALINVSDFTKLSIKSHTISGYWNAPTVTTVMYRKDDYLTASGYATGNITIDGPSLDISSFNMIDINLVGDTSNPYKVSGYKIVLE